MKAGLWCLIVIVLLAGGVLGFEERIIRDPVDWDFPALTVLDPNGPVQGPADQPPIDPNAPVCGVWPCYPPGAE